MRTQRGEAPAPRPPPSQGQAFAGAGYWLARHGPAVAQLRPVFLGDDLFACQPIAAAVQQAGGNFIFTCKPASHRTIAEYLQGAGLEERRQTTVIRGKRTTTVWRWLSGVPLRATEDALAVNWFSVEIQNNKGKQTYYNSLVAGLPVTFATVAKFAICGRARWKACPCVGGDRKRNLQCAENQRVQPRT